MKFLLPMMHSFNSVLQCDFCSSIRNLQIMTTWTNTNIFMWRRLTVSNIQLQKTAHLYSTWSCKYELEIYNRYSRGDCRARSMSRISRYKYSSVSPEDKDEHKGNGQFHTYKSWVFMMICPIHSLTTSGSFSAAPWLRYSVSWLLVEPVVQGG